MKKFNFLVLLISALVLISCDPNSFLTKEPTNVLSPEKVFANPDLVKSNIADLYNRIRQYQDIDQWWNFTNFDYAFPSNFGDYGRVKNQNYGYGSWSYWDYGYVHDLNLFIDRIREANQLNPSDQKRFLGEAHFLRANLYFKLVKRMGGVPILKDTLRYNFSGDASYLRHARAKESEVYDFVLSEADSAIANLPKDPGDKSRATWGAAMALKSRAALFAGSIAKHGASTPSVSLPGGEVGIPASKADGYYQIALDAAEKIIQSGEYSLYMKFPNDLQKNFAHLFLDKGNNPEVIFAQDHKLTDADNSQFTVNSQPHSLTEEGAVSGFLNPTLNFVQSFEKLDNTFATLKNKNADGSYVKYDNKGAIFSNRDARLGGTVMLPGSQFKGSDIDIWAGYMQPDGNIISGSSFGAKKTLPGQSNPTQVVGFDGPIDQLEHGTQTGFYIRKYLDPTVGAGQIGNGSNVWWVRYRYAEVLLNAAEAAFELGDNVTAAKYMNKVRARAGLTTPLTPGEITFNRVMHERLVELAFEGHKLWDMKRWRRADKIWNGGPTDLEHPEDADAPSTKPWGLWPYKVYDPGNADNGKWVFKRVLPGVVTNADEFRLGNYYSHIDDNILGNNPKLIQNPNQ